MATESLLSNNLDLDRGQIVLDLMI